MKLKSIIIGSIASVCALGTGLLAAATVISTPMSLLLLIGAGFMVNFSLPFIYQWFSRLWVRKKLDWRKVSHQKYFTRLLARTDDLDKISSKYARELTPQQTFLTVLGSLSLSLIAAAALYFSLTLVPTSVLSIVVASCMFTAMALVTLVNYYHGMEDVWEGRAKSYQTLKNLSPLRQSAIAVFILSALAVGILIGSMVLDGARTVIAADSSLALLRPLATAIGPVGWIIFGCMMVSASFLTSFGLFDLMDEKKRAQKLDMLRSFFTGTETYKNDLKNQWDTVNVRIAEIEKGYQCTEDEKQELNELYRQKDSVYHRYLAYSKPWFAPVYKIVSVLLLGLAMAGMFMHVARGFQSMTAIGISRKVSSALMYLSMLAEGFFTGVIVSSTMNEEAMLGKQTRQYEDHLARQEGRLENVQDNAYQASRGMHFLFDLMLGLFGAEGGEHGHGHGNKTGVGYMDKQAIQTPLGVFMGLRAGFERHGGDNKLLTFAYNGKGQIHDTEYHEEIPQPAPYLNFYQ